MELKDLLPMISKKFVIYPTSKSLNEIKIEFTPQIDKYIVAMEGEDICKVANSVVLFQEIYELERKGEEITELRLSDSKCYDKFCIVAEDSVLLKLQDRFITDVAVIVNTENKLVGIIDNLKAVKNLSGYVDALYIETKETLFEYKKIFETIEEEIFVTDQNGLVLRANPATEKLMGIPIKELVGKNVDELVENEVFKPSITRRALSQKKKLDGMMEYINTGKRVLVTVFPVYDDKGQIIRTVSTSKDVNEINKLRNELEEKSYELERKNQELNLLRDEVFSKVNFITNSQKMKSIKETIKKIAPLDLAILIQGESGVGKEVVAKAYHHVSPRANKPFVKINCSLIPENLLESELFGYESGAFTGANKQGKIGKIELADQGTLFLDEIGEIPLHVQVKLLEFLQDKEICRVGGTKKIKIDARVIAATNRDLLKMVDERTFRQDLFYRLNVIPVNIPSLRERTEDIPALAHYFVKQINNKYNMNKALSPEAMNTILAYEWPGNVREFEHTVERLIITSDSDLITDEEVKTILDVKPVSQGRIICTDIVPLKLAKKEIEQQLVSRAYEIHKSTYKAAEALGIDQSTVVKILKKYRNE